MEKVIEREGWKEREGKREGVRARENESGGEGKKRG